METTIWGLGLRGCSHPLVDGIWGIWGSYYDIPKTIFHLLQGDYKGLGSESNPPLTFNCNPKPSTLNPNQGVGRLAMRPLVRSWRTYGYIVPLSR